MNIFSTNLSRAIFGTYTPKKYILSWVMLILKITFVIYLKFKLTVGPIFYLTTLFWAQERILPLQIPSPAPPPPPPLS